VRPCPTPDEMSSQMILGSIWTHGVQGETAGNLQSGCERFETDVFAAVKSLNDHSFSGADVFVLAPTGMGKVTGSDERA
jgi:hypothetical protein